jgi:ubiquinone/menaquinone biosynthesis C-methylase UbiE
MADIYATIAEADQEVQERLATVLERRAADLQQQAMLRAYLAALELPPGAAVLDVGCGTGAASRVVARLPGIGPVVGVDPSPVFLARARELAADLANLSFAEADGRSLPYGNGTFDLLLYHTTLSHVPWPEQALAEACRILRPAGLLVVFDGNYTTTTLANGEFDPLQCCADAAMAALVHDRWLIPRLPSLLAAAGFQLEQQKNFSFVETAAPDYMLTFADRGADLLADAGRIGGALAAALKDEARRRVAAGTFYGAVAYACLIARKVV